jgi:hypothetical protein
LATFANSTYVPEGRHHPLILGQKVLITLESSCQRVLDNLYQHLQEHCPIINKGNLIAIPLKKLKVRIKIQEKLTALKTIRGSSSN